MEQEKPMVCTDKDFGRFYVALKLNLKTNRYECIYSHNQEVFEIARKTEDYDTFIQIYIERFIHDADKSKLRDFLLSDKLTENLVHGYAEQDIVYRRIESEKSYIKMRAKKYVDIKDNIAIITLHNVKRTYRSVMEMKRELQKNERDKTKQYWNMVSLLSTVLDHNNLSEAENQDNLIFFTKQMYRQLQKNYPEYGITDEEVEAVSHLAPIHDIGKIRVPVEILNKNGRLTDEEFKIMQNHTIIGASILENMGSYQDEELMKVAYQICRWHHERYDGKGYPDGLKGDEIPISAQVVSLADVYDALVSERVYKKAYSHEKAIEMITNGECGCFNPILLECLLDIQDRIKRKMKTGTPEDNPFKKREKKAELKEFENVKEDFMDVVSKNMEKEYTNLENDELVDFSRGGAKPRF